MALIVFLEMACNGVCDADVDVVATLALQYSSSFCFKNSLKNVQLHNALALFKRDTSHTTQ